MLYVSATCGKTFPTSVGRLLDCYEVKVLDIDTGEVLPKGQTGELCFRGDCRLKEYLHNPEATAKAIDHEGYFHSGDMGHLDENDNLHLTGRIKEIIKFQEFTVFPSDVESILASHDAVEATTVLRVRHTRYNEVARAFVKLKPNHNNVTVEELRKFCKGQYTIVVVESKVGCKQIRFREVRIQTPATRRNHSCWRAKVDPDGQSGPSLLSPAVCQCHSWPRNSTRIDSIQWIKIYFKKNSTN